MRARYPSRVAATAHPWDRWGTITDRYIHAAQVLFPGAAEKAEARMFGAG